MHDPHRSTLPNQSRLRHNRRSRNRSSRILRRRYSGLIRLLNTAKQHNRRAPHLLHHILHIPGSLQNQDSNSFKNPKHRYRHVLLHLDSLLCPILHSLQNNALNKAYSSFSVLAKKLAIVAWLLSLRSVSIFSASDLTTALAGGAISIRETMRMQSAQAEK